MKIKRVLIKDFKGIRDGDYTLGDNNVIRGANGSGKTTVLDAIYYVLTGKNTSEDKQFGIFPLHTSGMDAGKPIANAEPRVTLFIETDNGDEYSIIRTVKGKNKETKIFINEYVKKVEDIDRFIAHNVTDPDKFRLFFNPKYFMELHWKEKRSLFLQYFVTPTISDVLKSENLTISDQIIKELEMATPGDIEAKYNRLIADLKIDKNTYEARLGDVNAKLSELNSTVDSEETADLDELKEEHAKLTSFIRSYNETANKYNDQVDLIENTRRSLEQAESSKEIFIKKWTSDKRMEVHYRDERLEELTGKRQKLVTEWQKLKSHDVTTSKCPYCGSLLKGEMLEEAKQNHAELLRVNVESGKAVSEEIAQLKAEINADKDNTKPPVEQYDKKIATLKKNLEKYRSELGEKPKDISSYIAALSRVSTLIGGYGDYKKLTESRDMMIEAMKGFANKIDLYSTYVQEAKDYESAMTNHIVSKVNRNFDKITIDIYKTLKNGEKKETFELKLNGVPYKDLNRAGKIIAGMEIQKYFKKHARNTIPVIIDDFESYPSIDIREYVAEGEQFIITEAIDSDSKKFSIETY